MSGETLTIQQLENEIEQLTQTLREKKELLAAIRTREVRRSIVYTMVRCTLCKYTLRLFSLLQARKNENMKSIAVDITRYSRQIILSFVGLKGKI
jgi:hypothetical protein